MFMSITAIYIKIIEHDFIRGSVLNKQSIIRLEYICLIFKIIYRKNKTFSCMSDYLEHHALDVV